jgi:hypothetical protein
MSNEPTLVSAQGLAGAIREYADSQIELRLLEIFARLEKGESFRIGERDFQLNSREAQRSNFRYRGTWSAAESYEPGDFTTWSGSLWHAQVASKAMKPDDGNAVWVLCVKRGAAASNRDVKAHEWLDRLQRQVDSLSAHHANLRGA